jgi:hypothetical protein
MSHYAIRNPRRLSWERTPEGLWLLEAAEDSNRISVAASGERWNEALDDLWVRSLARWSRHVWRC